MKSTDVPLFRPHGYTATDWDMELRVREAAGRTERMLIDHALVQAQINLEFRLKELREVNAKNPKPQIVRKQA